jgi:hypothetical protein
LPLKVSLVIGAKNNFENWVWSLLLLSSPPNNNYKSDNLHPCTLHSCTLHSSASIWIQNCKIITLYTCAQRVSIAANDQHWNTNAQHKSSPSFISFEEMMMMSNHKSCPSFLWRWWWWANPQIQCCCRYKGHLCLRCKSKRTDPPTPS